MSSRNETLTAYMSRGTATNPPETRLKFRFETDLLVFEFVAISLALGIYLAARVF